MKLQLPALVLTATIGLAAQSPAPTPAIRFEVATIRQNVSGDTARQIRIEPSGRVNVTNYVLFDIIRNAYGVQPFQIIRSPNLPPWFDRDAWNIVAQPPADVVRSEQSMVTLLQNLLADRFKLVAKRETREMPVYALVLARADGRLGPQIRESSNECEAARLAREKGGAQAALPPIQRGFCGTRAGNGSVSTSAVRLADFARNLAPMTGRFIVDRTGLTGSYDLDLKWTPDQATGAAASAATDGTSLFAALEEQLGLKLEAQRAPVEVVVIESVERPTED